MSWLIALGVLLLLAACPLGVRVGYDADGPLVKLLAGPVRLTLYPRKAAAKKEKTKKKEKAPAHSDAPPKKPEKKPEKKQKGGSWRDFIPLVKTALAYLGDFRRKLRINHLYCRLILAGDDPCDLAMHYGEGWVALGNLLAVLEKTFVIQKRDVELECDFQADETTITFRADVTIRLGRLLWLLLRYGLRALKQYSTLRKTRKGGMNHE